MRIRSLFKHRPLTQYDAADIVTGPNVYKRLNAQQRAEFTDEWRATMAPVVRTFDPDPLKVMVRHWWVAAGGDPDTARLAADFAHTLATWREDTRSGFRALCDRYGPEVFNMLEPWQQVVFEEEWIAACNAAVDTYDVGDMDGVITLYWGSLKDRTPAVPG